MSLKSLEPKKPKSNIGVVEYLRGVMEEAFKKQIIYFDISYKVKGEARLRRFTFGGTHRDY